MVKNLPAKAGDTGSIPGLESSSKEGNDNPFQYSFFFFFPFQYSCLENPMDRGASRAIVHRVAKLDTT